MCGFPCIRTAHHNTTHEQIEALGASLKSPAVSAPYLFVRKEARQLGAQTLDGSSLLRRDERLEHALDRHVQICTDMPRRS